MRAYRANLFLLPFTMLILGGLAGTDARAGNVSMSFDPTNFTNPLTIDNPYWPLVAGTTFVYRTASDEDCEVNDVTVTPNTKPIAGVMTREVHDQVWEDLDCDGTRGALLEDTLDWYAQDDAGNIWYFGESTSEATPSCTPAPDQCNTEGSWEAGQDVAAIGSVAQAGVVILADPRPGNFYQQEFYAGEAEDQGKVLRLNAKVSLTLDNQIDPDKYAGCMKTKETSPLEKGVVEHKYYCPGAGLVLIEELKGKTVRTELVEIQ
ncbi:MAG TPA: hypothetical protein VIE44_00455 [Methylomirabilota bacterium]